MKLRKEKVLRTNDELMKEFMAIINDELLTDIESSKVSHAQWMSIIRKYDSMLGNFKTSDSEEIWSEMVNQEESKGEAD